MSIFQISVDQSTLSKSSSTSINPFLSNFLRRYNSNKSTNNNDHENVYNDEDDSVDAFSTCPNNSLELSTEYYLPSHFLSLSNVEIETKEESSFSLKRNNKEHLYHCQSLIDITQISDFHSNRPVIEEENEHLLKPIENDIEKFADNKSEESIPHFSNLDSSVSSLICNSLSFDTNSGNSLERFLNYHQTIDNSLLNSSENCQKFSKSTSIFYTSPVETNQLSSTPSLFSLNKMNVASKKRGLFGRSTTKNVSNNLSSSINEHEQENGTKLKSTPLQSSPLGTSHHLNELDEDRFNGDGVMFQGKLIGHEYVAEARGEQMCQQSLKKLKIIQKALGGHKRKINMFISFDGIKITDSNSNEELFHHAVPQISFISRDETDTRAFGYVFGNSQTGHQFIGIKSKKEAMVVMSTIGQLFAITLKRKRNAEESIAVTTTVNSSITQSGEEHLYHSVQDQRIDICNTNDFSVPISVNKTGRIRNNTISSGNVSIPALPPPTEQHPRHRQNQQINRFATVGRINDPKNSVQTKQTSSLINELDLFQPISNQNFDSSKNINNHLTASSCDWAHFDDDNPPTLSTLSQAHEDSTLNTISSISDTLTATNNTMTINESVTLVESGNNAAGKYPPGQNVNNSVLANKVNNSKLNVSSTTISSTNFDGMDPFSDAFGSDDPFSNISTTADISSDVFSNRINSQINNRPPSNPGPNTMFNSNKLSFKNLEAVSGSVPLLANSLGSITLDNEVKQPKTNINSNTFKSTVELSSTKNNPDKYAVLHDINSISTSIFDSLGNSSGNAMRECEKQKTTTTTNTKTTTINDNWQISTPTQTAGGTSISNQSFSQPIDYSSKNNFAPKSFCNVSYNQQNSNPINFGANGIVVLPPVVVTSSGYSSTTTNSYCQQQSLNYASDYLSKNSENNFSIDLRQPPKAEFDSMSNLSSTSSNASSSNNNATGINKSLLQTSVNSEKKLIPIFQELDPLNKTKSPLNIDARNRSPMPNLLDSSLSSINSSNSSLFNSRNCSTPNSLHRKSPQLLSQHSLPTNTSTASSRHLKHIQLNQNNSLDLVSNNNQLKDTSSASGKNVINTKTSISSTEKPNPHYIMLCNLSTAVATNNYDKNNNENKILNEFPQKEEDYVLSVTSSQNKNDEKEKSEISLECQKINEKNIVEEDNKIEAENGPKLESENKAEECLDNVNNTNIAKHSRTSSISSSSNSLLINQSNFSELKFDDVFETPLLSENNTDIKENDDKEITSEDTSHKNNSSEEQTPALKCFDNLATKPEDISSKSELKHSSINNQSTRSISRQSSNASCSTPPIVPPRTDLHSNNKFPNHQITPPPLLPPPNSIIHHLPYGSQHGRLHPHAPHIQPPLLPQHFPSYYSSYYSSSPCGGFQDQTYADPIALRHRSNSHRYWNSAYDSWYGVHDNQMYNQLPQAPPPPVPGRPLDYSTSAYHHSPPMPDYFHHQGNRQFSTSSEGSTSSWQEYYHIQQPPNLQVIPSSSPHSSFIHQFPHQMQQTQALSTSSGYTNIQNVESENSSCDKPITEANDNNNKPLNASQEFTNEGSDYKEPIPPLPNPQRRISSSSVLSGCSNKQNQISSSNATLSTPIITSSAASTLRRSLSNSSSSIPPYSPLLTNDHYYSVIQPNVYSNYEDLPNNKSLQHFAAFNMNMEQMIMKYHQQQSSAPRNNSPLPPYDYYMAGSMPYYHPQFSYQNPTRIRTPHLNQPMDMTSGASAQGSLILPPHYGCGNSTGSGSSSGYSSTISHMAMPMDINSGNNSDNKSPGPWKTIQPLLQSRDVLWDNNNNSVISGKTDQSNQLLFDDNFASISYEINNEVNDNQYDTVKRKQGEIKINDNSIGNKVESETEKKMESNYENKQQQESVDKTETVDRKESNPITMDSPEERNIFLTKDDPFEDDPFFKS